MQGWTYFPYPSRLQVPRAVPMVEAMVALVLVDHLLQHFAQCELLDRSGAVGADSSLALQFHSQRQQMSKAQKPSGVPEQLDPVGAGLPNKRTQEQ